MFPVTDWIKGLGNFKPNVKIVNSDNEELFTKNRPANVNVVNATGGEHEYRENIINKTSPFPPRTDVEIKDAINTPQWMDGNGTLWLVNENQGLNKSSDKGESWEKVLDCPATGYGPLVISDTGRAIWATSEGEIWVTDEGKTEWSLLINDTSAGHFSNSYGHSKYKNVILFSTYGTKDSTNSPRFVYGSFDHGESWKIIYEGPNRIDYHIHDVAYDPWAGRIWVTQGDMGGRNISYSDDEGMTWKHVWRDETGSPVWGVGRQPTSIMPTPHGVIFGTDQEPDGIDYWFRPEGTIQPIVHPEDIKVGYFKIDEKNAMRHVFRRGWYDIESQGSPVYVLGVGADSSHADGFPRIIVSYDGITFHEVWKLPEGGGSGGIQWIVGPFKDDPEQLFWAACVIDGTTRMITGKIPKKNSI